MSDQSRIRLENFSFASSVKDDVWHPKSAAHGYEWWYFDALSDDGKDTLVIIFLDNFIFSPRYNKSFQRAKIESKEADNTPHSKVPALAFVYYRDGKPLYRAVNEFSPEHFSAGEDHPNCRIGGNTFKFESAPYGSGYSLSIKTELPRRRKLEANLEWLSIESDLLPSSDFNHSVEKHNWNLVAPRSDVTGSIKVSDVKGKLLDVRHFRGTGYHDHNSDSRWLPAAVKNWQWGRAHFDDYTAVYYRYCELDSAITPLTKLFLIKDNKIEVFDAEYQEENFRRNIFGLKFPKQIKLAAENGVELNIQQVKSIDQSFFYLRFLSEANLKDSEGKIHEAFAITEHLDPKSLKYRWLDWLISMRIGKNGKGSFL